MTPPVSARVNICFSLSLFSVLTSDCIELDFKEISYLVLCFQWEVDEIVRHATKRGVRVLPEFDSPAHVGAGWDALDPEFTLCVNKVKQELQCSQKRRRSRTT